MIIRISICLLLFTIIIFFFSCKEEAKGPFNKWKEKDLNINPEFLGEKPVNELDVDFIKEASGIDASILNPGYFYVNNDSGSPTDIYMIDSLGHYSGKIKLEGIENRDWEELSTGPGPDNNKTYIYIGDIGDNKTRHPIYFIYRLEETILKKDHPGTFDVNAKVDKIAFQYPEGKSYNCEAFTIDPISKTIYLFTKGNQSRLFKLPYPQSLDKINTAIPIVSLPINKVTAADLSGDGKSMLLKDYHHIYYWDINLKPLEELLSNSKPQLLNYQIEAQGEALCWSINGKSFYTLSEAEDKPSQYLIRYNKK